MPCPDSSAKLQVCAYLKCLTFTTFKSFAQGRHHSDWLHTWNSPNTILQHFGVWSSENNFPQARKDIVLGSSTRNSAHSSSAWNDIWFVRFQNFMNTTHFEEIWSSFTCIQPSKDDILLHDYVFLLHFPGMLKVLPAISCAELFHISFMKLLVCKTVSWTC